MKAYSNLEQSKKLAEFLPLESADMYYGYRKDKPEFLPISDIDVKCLSQPCWSLATLLGVLPKEIVCDKGIVFLEFHVWENSLEYVNNTNYTLYATNSYDNAIDACYELVLKLHEESLL